MVFPQNKVNFNIQNGCKSAIFIRQKKRRLKDIFSIINTFYMSFLSNKLN